MKPNKVLGALLIAAAVLSDKKDAQVGLGLLGLAALFPDETKKVLDAVSKSIKTTGNRAPQSN